MGIAFLSTVTIACVEMAVASPAALAPSVATAVTAQLETAVPETTPETAPEDEASAPLVFADKSDDEVIEEVLAYIRGLGTMRGDFTQIAPSGGITRGEFHLRRPNQLRFEYEPPTPLLIVATQGNVYVHDAELETTDFYPIKKTPLRFLLGKKVELTDARVVAVDRGVDTVAVTFASEDEETEGELSIILKAPEFSLDQWAVRDVQNGITVVTLNNVIEGEKFRNALFKAPEAGGEFLKN